jgi:hypothetical protein
MQTINIQFQPEVEFTVCPQRKINLTKLVSWNNRQPFEKRIVANELQEKLEYAKMRGNVAALCAQVHEEVKQKIEENYELIENL